MISEYFSTCSLSKVKELVTPGLHRCFKRPNDRGKQLSHFMSPLSLDIKCTESMRNENFRSILLLNINGRAVNNILTLLNPDR